ncbi:MAG TPA: RidA family protein [Gaiellales bacterium]|nr:RidA family protein [Gaiellales bacterium]
MGIEHVNPPGLFPGAPYHYAAITEAGRMVFAAGACPIDEDGVVVPGGIQAQAQKAVANLFVALDAAGAAKDDVLKTTVYVASSNQAELVQAWEVIAAAFSPARPPSTLLGVAVLGYTDQLVEIEAVAVSR